jgi:hypothetical protein
MKVSVECRQESSARGYIEAYLRLASYRSRNCQYPLPLFYTAAHVILCSAVFLIIYNCDLDSFTFLIIILLLYFKGFLIFDF